LAHLASLVCLVHLVCLVDLVGRFNQINQTSRTIATGFFESQSGERAPGQRSGQDKKAHQETEKITSISTGAPRGNSAAPTATRA
jgi:hypothetical protein